ncbi:MAG: PAS domain-containing protein [Deltaproteobacteria bacterium]|nr:PAS domain-containing protein [Deltaproteobacteria bacterium]
MPDSNKSKKELLDELTLLKSRIAQLDQKTTSAKTGYFDWTRKYQFFESFIDELIEPLIVIDTNYQVKYANKAACQISGSDFSFCNQKNIPCHKLLFRSDIKCDEAGQSCLLTKVIQGGRHATIDYTVKLENGETIIYEILGSPIWEKDGSVLGMVATIRDVTQHRTDQKMLESGHDFLELRVQERMSELIDLNQALRQEIRERQETEQRLRWSKEQAELIYELSPCAIFTVNSERYVTSWNKKAEEISGYSVEEIKGRKCLIFCSQPCRLFSTDTEKPIINFECTLLTKDGRKLVITKNSDVLRDPSGKIIGGIESFEDVTQQKKMDMMLRAERDKIQGMIAATRQGLHILNSNYEIEFQNDFLKKIFGDQIGSKCYEVYKQRSEPCVNCRMHSVIQNNQIEHADEDIIFSGKHYSQSYAPFKDTDGQTKCLILLRDITVEKANRAKTLRTAQLASIGELAAGVAHEINNPINGIINYAQIVMDDTVADDPRNILLRRLINEGERVADIVSKLLAFARQSDDEKDSFEEIAIRNTLENSLSLFQHQFLKDGIMTTITIPPDIPLLRVHPHQLQQVFVNLLSNAKHALNDRYKGPDPDKLLEITARLICAHERNQVKITFTDHGTGIPQQNINMVFNPFYSTKKPGEGTGLGLSISQGIIQSFQGQMSIESEFGKFTQVIIELPVPAN